MGLNLCEKCRNDCSQTFRNKTLEETQRGGKKKAARAFVSAERTDEDREEEMTGAWKISGVKRILHTCLCFFVLLSSPLPFMSFIKMFTRQT